MQQKCIAFELLQQISFGIQCLTDTKVYKNESCLAKELLRESLVTPAERLESVSRPSLGLGCLGFIFPFHSAMAALLSAENALAR